MSRSSPMPPPPTSGPRAGPVRSVPRATALAALALLPIQRATSQTTAAPTIEAIPPLETASPRMRFHEGRVQDNQPLIDPALPAIPGPPSPWYVAQWGHRQYLSAGGLAVHHDAKGAEVYAFSLPDGSVSLVIRPGEAAGTHVYDLFEDGGTLTAGGGSNLFLSTGAGGDATFDRPIRLALTAQIRTASVRYDGPAAETTGAVLAMSFIGLGALNRDPATGALRFVFVQIPVTVSRPLPAGPGVMCSLAGGRPNMIYSPSADPSRTFPFREGGAARRVEWDLSGVIAAMIARPYPCGGTMRAWNASERVLAHWRLTGVYAGLEVQDRDTRPGAATHAPQGEARLGVEFHALDITMPPRSS